LLRAATAPDAEQDQGKHNFSWAVMPHEGHFLESSVPEAAYLFNSPLYVRYLKEEDDISLLSSLRSPFVVQGARNVFLETVKRGEDDNFGLKDFDWANEATTFTIVLRLYEAFGGHARAHLKIARHIPVSRAYITNLLEDEGDELNLGRVDNSEESAAVITLDFHGFEVKTVKLVIGYHGRGKAEPDEPKREGWVTVDKAGLLVE
jgi:alpha-mannosidase